MKKSIFYIGIPCLALLGFFLIQQKDVFHEPQPTEVLGDLNDEAHHKARQEWYEMIHMTAPGVDWKQMDNESRAALRINRTDLRRFKTSETTEIADGLLVGKWTEKGANNVAGRMHNIDIDFENNIIYGASDGGQIWRGDMNGDNWESLTDSYHVKGVHYLRIMDLEGGGKRILQANRDSLLMFSDNEGLDWNISEGLDARKNDRC